MPEVTVDVAGHDAVDPDVVGAELHRQRLGEAGHRPLRGDVRRAAGEAEDAGGRHHVDEHATLLGLEHWGDTTGAIELGVDAHTHAVGPLLVGDVLDHLRRAADAGVVHHDVEAAGQDLVEDGVELGGVGDVAFPGGDVVGEGGETARIDVAGEDLGAELRHRHRGGAAHAVAAGGDECALAFEGDFHGRCFL